MATTQWRLLLLMLVLWPLSETVAADEFGDVVADAVTPQERIVEQRRDFYNRHFREIQFVFLPGGTHWIDDIELTYLLLGYQPSSLVYEHPPELRQELMDVSIHQLVQMLREQMPYAALFRADQPMGWRENVCVISLDPVAVAADDRVATRFMFELDAATVERLPAGKRLPARPFLRYLIDHEVFHCLDAFYNGPQPMSQEQLWAQYYNYRRENGADAFALAMNRREAGDGSALQRIIRDYRAIAIVNGDPDHWTYDAIRQVQALPLEQWRERDMRAVLAEASGIRDALVADYPAYLSFRAAALQAMAELRADAAAVPTTAGSEVDPVLLQRLKAISRDALRANPHLAP